jgi:8-oxo-dGTP pyrophosphatase MutT (NUDIX family)
LSGAGRRETIVVVAAVVRRGDRYLVGLRPQHKRHGGLWEFPGGKLREGESRLDAATRELGEELDLTVVALGRLLLAVEDEGSPFVIEFYETTVTGTPEAREHSEVGWLTVAELGGLDLAPADARLVRRLAGRAG